MPLSYERFSTFACRQTGYEVILFILKPITDKMMLFKKPIVYFYLFFASYPTLFGQTAADSTALQQDLTPVTVNSTRLPTSETRPPFAMTILNKERLQVAQQQISLYEPLGAVPGVFVQNPDNFAQDLRIAIRGFGARAQFGIRGIKILTDGIPESTPDGQVKTGGIDAGFMGRMEVIRGPAAGIWGNASGGVISFTTEDPTEKPSGEVNISIGERGFGRFQAKAGQKVGKIHWIASASRLTTDGYRNFSRAENMLANAKIRYDLNEKTNITLLLNLNSLPNAQDSGGITQAMSDSNRQQARPQNVQFNAGTSFTQQRIALIINHKTDENHELNARLFYTNRDFSNRLAVLASGMIHFNRDFAGGGANYRYSNDFGNLKYRFNMGLDVENQSDARTRYDNKNGVQGKLTLDQTEIYSTSGVYLLQELSFKNRLTLTLGSRYDEIRTSVKDLFWADGDQSNNLSFNKVSPMAGLSCQLAPASNVYVNYSTSFETASLNELSNNPTGLGGFNADLQPTRAVNVEFGVKSFMMEKFYVSAALFQIQATNELVPYQLAAFPNKTFYKNAGETERKGIELGLTARLYKGLTAIVNYTYSDFKYKTFLSGAIDYSGKMMPGLPQHTAYAELRYIRPSGAYATAQYRYVDSQFAEDANVVKVGSYSLVNFRAGYRLSVGESILEPFIGVNNAFDVLYMANVQLNALGGRYFEPSMGRNVFGGLKIRFE
jgi:iron complex outermembrane recepter protein